MSVIHRFWSGLWANLYRFFLSTVGFQDFLQFWNGCELLCGLKRSAFDRARRVLSMGIIYRFWSGLWANRARHFNKYMIFSSFFEVFEIFLQFAKVLEKK